MIIEVNILGLFMKNRINGYMEACYVTTGKHSRLRVRNKEIIQNSLQPHNLIATSICSSILKFYCGQVIVCCFLDFQEIKGSPRKQQKQAMDLCVSRHAWESESEKVL